MPIGTGKRLQKATSPVNERTTDGTQKNANPQASGTVTINRTLVGVIAVVLLAGAGLFWASLGSQHALTGACLKVGSVMAALWLALPTISRHGNWGQVSWGSVIAFMGLALALTGKRVSFQIAFPILLGVAITMLVLRPKSKTRPK